MAETKPVFTYVSIDYLRTHSTQIFNKTLEWVLMENFIPIDIFVDPICLYLLAKMLYELGFRLGCDSLTVSFIGMLKEGNHPSSTKENKFL